MKTCSLENSQHKKKFVVCSEFSLHIFQYDFNILFFSWYKIASFYFILCKSLNICTAFICHEGYSYFSIRFIFA